MFGKSKKIVSVLIFTLIFASAAFAQTEKPQIQPKIVVVFPELFEDEKNGIRDLVEANKKLELEFKSTKDELTVLSDQIAVLEKEFREMEKIVESPGCCTKDFLTDLETKANKYEKLKDEFNKKKSVAKALYDKRKAELTVEINKKIAQAVAAYAKEKGYDAIVDGSKLPPPVDGLSVCYNVDLDITRDFIKYYNKNLGDNFLQ